jgi:hypothetical protein
MTHRNLPVVIVLVFFASACNRALTALPTETPGATLPLPATTPSSLQKSTPTLEPTSTPTNMATFVSFTPTPPNTLTSTLSAVDQCVQVEPSLPSAVELPGSLVISSPDGLSIVDFLQGENREVEGLIGCEATSPNGVYHLAKMHPFGQVTANN